jgi:hypothetical protein
VFVRRGSAFGKPKAVPRVHALASQFRRRAAFFRSICGRLLENRAIMADGSAVPGG